MNKKTAAAFIKSVEANLKAGLKPRGVAVAGSAGEQSALRAAAEAVGVGVGNMHKYLAQCERAAGRKVDWSQRKQESQPAEVQITQDRERQRLNDAIRDLRTRLSAAHRELNAAEDLRSAVFGLTKQVLTPPTWTVERKAARGGSTVPILFFSDAQWGEFVRTDELGGINEFNHSIARARYRRLIDRTIDLSFSHMVKPNYPGIIYVRGGDMISGDIHQELRETNDLQSIPAVRDLVQHEIWGITQLVKAFGKVRVISVPGNHGRTTIKPQSKQYVETNYDTLSAWMIEQWFTARGEKRVSFWTPESGDALFPVFGWNFLVTHGDRIGSRGGQGFIGPAATIARGMKKVIDYYAGLGRLIDWVLVGHFHTYMELEYGFCNGSLPGFTQYARDYRFRPKPPTQLLFFVHPEWGITARWPILLEKQPRQKMPVGDMATFGAAA